MQMMMRHSDMRELVWSRSTNSMSKVSDSISAELHDLLDKLLAPEEDERLDIAGIKVGAWGGRGSWCGLRRLPVCLVHLLLHRQCGGCSCGCGCGCCHADVDVS